MSNVLSVDRRLANVRDRGERDVVKPAGVIHGDKHSIAYQRFARVIDCDRKASTVVTGARRGVLQVPLSFLVVG
jgi:hypothetical protein